jgi:hypothetical protein
MNTLRPAPPAGRRGIGPSAAIALAVTAAMMAIVVSTTGGLPLDWWRDEAARPTTERVTYVAPPLAVVPPVPVPRPAPQLPPATRTAPSQVPAVTPVAPTAPRATTAPTTVAPGLPGTSAAPRDTGSGAPGRDGVRGTAGSLAPTISPLPLRVGASRPEAGPLTPSQMDSAWQVRRAEMFSPRAIAAAVAAGRDDRARTAERDRFGESRSTGGARVVKPVAAVSITTGLLGGPPSPAQRKKNEAIDADVRARLATVAERAKARADSLRKRDSLRIALDSGRIVAPRRDSL